MATHKFHVGQKVKVVGGTSEPNLPRGEYEIVGQLPESDGEFNYRIKSQHETHQRVVKESHLRRSSDEE